MKVIIVALAFVAVAAAAAVDYVPQILRSESDQSPDGSYQYAFESDDGTKREEVGQATEILNEEGKPQKVVFVRGSFSFKDSEGNLQEIVYTADDKGFHPEGPSIPKSVSRR